MSTPTTTTLEQRRSDAGRKAAATRRANAGLAPRPAGPALRAASLGECMTVLASVCDGAYRRDAAGFSGVDTRFGKSLAALPEALWEPETSRMAWEMLRKYRGQLAAHGIDFARVPEPGSTGPVDRRAVVANASRTITATDELFEIRFRYDMSLVDQVKKLPRRKFVVKGREKFWTVPLSMAAAVRVFAKQHGFKIVGAVPVVVDDAPEAAPAATPGFAGEVTVEGANFVIALPRPFAAECRAQVAAMPNREWVADSKTWRVPVRGSAALVVGFARAWGLTLPPGLAAKVDEVEAATAAMRTASSAADADIEVPGLAPGLSLLPYQRAGVAYAVKAKRCFIADEMGLGKTLQAMATVVHERAFPAVCIVPQPVRSNWAAEWAKFFPGVTVRVLSGNKRNVKGADEWQPLVRLIDEANYGPAQVTIINYDVIGAAEYDSGGDKAQLVKTHGHVTDLIALAPRAVVIDESHFVKTPGTRRTLAVRALAESVVANHGAEAIILALTGTPATNRPAELVSQLTILGRINEFGGPNRYKANYCRGEKSEPNLPELNDRLRVTCWVRRKKADVYSELPAVMRGSVSMDTDPAVMVEYRKAEADVAEFLANRARELATESGLDDDEARQAYWEKKMRIEAVAHLVVVGQLKRLAARAKMAAAKAWVRNFLDSGDEKVLVFAEHRDVVDELQATFGCDKIQGGQTSEDRLEVVNRFQTGDARVLVLSLGAGGTGLTLTAASNVAFLEQGWNPAIHDQAEARCYGRVNDMHGANAYYLLAFDTIDVRIAELIADKRRVLNAVNDGVPVESDANANASVLGTLLVELAHKGLDRVGV